MEIMAYSKYLRQSPRKVRLVANAVKNLPILRAVQGLTFMRKGAANSVLATLNSALANAKHNYNLEEKNLKIKHILVEEGPRLKRFDLKPRGAVGIIQKRMSHIKVVLEDKGGEK